MSIADDIKRVACRLNCKGLLFPPATVAITTERPFGQRALNGIFRPRSPPHLASEPRPGKSSLQTTSPSCFYCSQIHAICGGFNLSIYFCLFPLQREKRRPVFWLKMRVRAIFFAHVRDFHASANFLSGRVRHCRALNKGPKPTRKRRRAAVGEDGSTNFLGTGVPKPPPAFPRSKNFSQAALHPIL